MFIGRKNELLQLNRLYNSGKFEFAVIYGRRRVGKTAIINEFVKDKNAICFTGVETNAKQNLENLSECILEFSTGMKTDTAFSNFQSALEYVFKLSENKRIVLCLDEYPSMSYMEDHVLAYKAPLYGRRTAQFKILPFEFCEACEYFNGMSPEDKALAYGLVGGTPQYLLQINNKISIEDNIKNIFLNPVSALYEEPNNLLKQEVREPAIYNAVITAIATGASKISEISTKVGETSSTCVAYVKNLVALGIVRKEVPYGEKSTKKTIYSIEDNMFRFWYRFVPENSSIISRGAVELAYSRIAPYLSDYMGAVFEEICKQYLWKRLLNGDSEIDFTDIGRWWGTNPKTRQQEEIDIIGSADKNTALFGECKWRNESVDLGILETLVERSKLFNFSKKHFYIFSKSGFTKGCIDKANELENVSLIAYDDILKYNLL